MSERTVYAIASGKGGVGKTTTAINLGAMLADRGHEVVVVDTDLGMANLADFLDFEIETPTLHEVLAEEADFEEAIDSAPGDIDVLPSATDIEAFARSDPTNLQHVIEDLREEYDYVLLDTGAGVSYDTLVPLALADAVLLVATPDVASVRDTAKTGELAERVESEVVGAVLTQRSSDILNADDVEETLGTDVLAVVPEDEAVPMGIDAGRPLAAFAPNAPAGQAYRDLAAVLTGEAEPDPELDLAGNEDESESESTTSDDQPDADAFAGAELAENVRDAIGSDDGPEGLLGGELANAADEIRKQATADSASSSDVSDDSGTEPDATDDRETETDTDEDVTGHEITPASGGNEPRSVDDLINEHISDDRLGDDNTFGEDDSSGEDADAPLAGGSEGGGGDDESLAEERDPFADDGDESASGSAVGDARAATTARDGNSDESTVLDASEDEEVNDGASGADEASFEDDRDGSRDADEVDDEFPNDEATWDGADDADDDRETDGLIGRIGSLFK